MKLLLLFKKQNKHTKTLNYLWVLCEMVGIFFFSFKRRVDLRRMKPNVQGEKRTLVVHNLSRSYIVAYLGKLAT